MKSNIVHISVIGIRGKVVITTCMDEDDRLRSLGARDPWKGAGPQVWTDNEGDQLKASCETPRGWGMDGVKRVARIGCQACQSIKGASLQRLHKGLMPLRKPWAKFLEQFANFFNGHAKILMWPLGSCGRSGPSFLVVALGAFARCVCGRVWPA